MNYTESAIPTMEILKVVSINFTSLEIQYQTVDCY